MIPRISKGGASFRGAQAYYLHDKAASTTDRIGFVHTVNLPTNDADTPIRNAERGFAVMAWTAMHQAEIKAAAGTKATGRALEKPVYTYSLSWHADDKPSDDHMREAALSSLKALGMDKCQAVILSHTDTLHPHCHVILNRVDPTTGKAASTSRDHLILSKWAEKWERDHGMTRVPDRIRNNALREQEAAKAKPERKIVKGENLTREEYQRMNNYRMKTPSSVRAERAAQHKADVSQLESKIARRELDAKRAIVAAYGPARDLMTKQITDLQTVMDRKGLFASIVRFKKRLTGQLSRDTRTLAALNKGRDNLDRRVAERLNTMKAKNERERAALSNRHKNELERDNRYIAWRESGTHSQSTGGFQPKAIRTRSNIGPRFIPTPAARASISLDHNAAVSLDAASAANVAKAEQPEKTKRYSRAEGRGSGRTEGRSRNRTRDKGDRELGD